MYKYLGIVCNTYWLKWEPAFKKNAWLRRHALRHACEALENKCLDFCPRCERWAGDGHDKLYSIGFPIWAVVDDAMSKWLGAWVVLSNRMGNIIGYLFLTLVEKYSGMFSSFDTSSGYIQTYYLMLGIPLEFSTDCSSETTQLFGLVSALWYVHVSSSYDLSHVFVILQQNLSSRVWQ